jgi:hypothetical protein
MSADQSAVGCFGELIVATRGSAGPGEVLVRMRGGTEAYLAWENLTDGDVEWPPDDPAANTTDGDARAVPENAA